MSCRTEPPTRAASPSVALGATAEGRVLFLDHLELEPALLGLGEGLASKIDARRSGLEGAAVSVVDLGVGQQRVQGRDLGLKRLDLSLE